MDLIIKTTIGNQQHQQQQTANTDYPIEDSSILKHLLNCIHYFTTNLKKRVNYIKDSSTFNFKEFYISDFELFSKSMINISKKSNRTGSNPPDSSRSTVRSTNKDNFLNTSLYSTASSGLSSIKSLSIEVVSTTSSSSSLKYSNKKTSLSNMKSTTSSNNSKNLKTSVSQPVLGKKAKSSNKNNAPGSTHSPISSLDENQFHLDQDYYEENHNDLPKIDETIINDLQDSIDAFITETNIENYETDLNEKHTIRQTQEWPIHSFCFKLLSTLIDNLNLILVRNHKNYAQNAANFQLKSSLLPVICETIDSLIDILYETKEEWRRYNINDILSTLFQKLNMHIKYCVIKADEMLNSKNLNILNRIIYINLVITFYKMINLLYNSDETSILIPNDLSEIIFLIMNDICLMDSFKSMSLVFSTILVNLDKNLYDIYLLSNEICDSMRCACEFLQKYDQMVF
jgi:hypothetical protein